MEDALIAKQKVRQQALAQRNALTPEQVKTFGQQVIQKLIQCIPWEKFHIVHVYLSCEQRKEIDTKPLLEYLWAEQPHITTVTNRIQSEDGQMDCYVIHRDSILEKNKYGIFEPLASAQKIEPTQIDLMIIPLLACDQQGYRIGYGKGYYDRLLARCSSTMRRVGINYFAPLAERFSFTAAEDDGRKMRLHQA